MFGTLTCIHTLLQARMQSSMRTCHLQCGFPPCYWADMHSACCATPQSRPGQCRPHLPLTQSTHGAHVRSRTHLYFLLCVRGQEGFDGREHAGEPVRGVDDDHSAQSLRVVVGVDLDVAGEEVFHSHHVPGSVHASAQAGRIRPCLLEGALASRLACARMACPLS